MAARIRRELETEVDMIPGKYGEFKVLVDNQTLIDAGPLAFLGIMPSGRKIVAAVRARLSERQ